MVVRRRRELIREKSSRTTVVGVIVICLLGARQVDGGFNQQVYGDLCHLANYHHICARSGDCNLGRLVYGQLGALSGSPFTNFRD